MHLRESDICAVLNTQWNLHVSKLAPAPRGFVAETYYADTSSERYFVKVVHSQNRFIENIGVSLPVLHEMNEHEITNIGVPIRQTQDQYLATLSDSVVSVYTYISGNWTMKYSKVKFLKILKRVHELKTNSFKILPKKELFTYNFKTELLSGLSALSQAREMQLFLGIDGHFIQEVYRAIEYLEYICALCKITDYSYVITHGDAPGNVIKDSTGELFLIDWDDILLAPIERDLWFHRTDAALQKVYPSYTPNERAYSFYVLKRYLDDVSGFLDEIFKKGAHTRNVLKNISGFKRDILGWLKPLAEKIMHTS